VRINQPSQVHVTAIQGINELFFWTWFKLAIPYTSHVIGGIGRIQTVNLDTQSALAETHTSQWDIHASNRVHNSFFN
jgi:hypothetical protein